MKTKLLSILALLLVAVTGAWAQDTYNVTFKANGNTKTVENVTLPKTFSCDLYMGNGELDLIIQELYGLSGGYCDDIEAPNSSGSENVTCGIIDDENHFITVSAPFDGTATVTGKYMGYNSGHFTYSLEITCSQPAPAGFTASFTAANAYTIKGGKASVSVDGGIATLDEEGKLPDINEGQQITITAKPGYKFRKVTAEKEAAPVPATTVTWNSSDFYFDENPYTKDGVTLTPSNGMAANGNNLNYYGDNTFTTTLGKFIKIEIVFESTTYSFDGWTKETAGKYQPMPDDDPTWWEDLYKLTWTGDAESVTIKGKDVFGIHSITFTIQ